MARQQTLGYSSTQIHYPRHLPSTTTMSFNQSSTYDILISQYMLGIEDSQTAGNEISDDSTYGLVGT